MTELKIAADGVQLIHQTLAQVHGWLKDTQGFANNHLDMQLMHTLAENQVSQHKK